MNNVTAEQNNCLSTTRQTTLRFAGLCLIWAILFIAGSWALKSSQFNTPVNWLLALIPTLFGVICIINYLKVLNTDELYRKIQLDSLAIGFGTGVLAGTCYPLFNKVGLPVIGMDALVAVMIFAWITAQIIATWKYR